MWLFFSNRILKPCERHVIIESMKIWGIEGLMLILKGRANSSKKEIKWQTFFLFLSSTNNMRFSLYNANSFIKYSFAHLLPPKKKVFICSALIFLTSFSPLLVCMLKIFSILKKNWHFFKRIRSFLLWEKKVGVNKWCLAKLYLKKGNLPNKNKK